MAKLLSAGSLAQPQLDTAFSKWVSNVTFKVLTQNVVNGFVEDTWEDKRFKGCVVPYYNENMQYDGSAGQRSWQMMQVFVANDAILLKIGDDIQWNGGLYKVIGRGEFVQNGFREYVMKQDYA